MANYFFETMTQAEATAFTNADVLLFGNSATTPSNVTVDLIVDNTVLTAGGKTLIFSGAALAGAQLDFASTDATLVLGSNGADDLEVTGNAEANGTTTYGFAGNDELDGGSNADNIFGGAGDDSIGGGDGADHLYGFGLTGDPTTDGDDLIFGGDGNDYIQGNAGADTLNGDAGSDRINGGGDADEISGGLGNDTVNGNKGDDSIYGGDGNDALRGGQGDDSILGEAGNDVLSGDLGDDTLVGGAGIDQLIGGEGADVFRFAVGSSTFTTNGAAAGQTDSITDFTVDEDTIQLGFLPDAAGDIVYQAAGVTFSAFTPAVTYAQQLLDANGGVGDYDTVVALQVGSDTYLFYNDAEAATTATSAIKLSGVTATTITLDSFSDLPEIGRASCRERV